VTQLPSFCFDIKIYIPVIKLPYFLFSQHILDTSKNEMVCKGEAESAVPHSTDEPVWTPKMKEKWWQCQNAQREQVCCQTYQVHKMLNYK
jgi:hypothetical protein